MRRAFYNLQLNAGSFHDRGHCFSLKYCSMSPPVRLRNILMIGLAKSILIVIGSDGMVAEDN
jgi:hypothetical protein